MSTTTEELYKPFEDIPSRRGRGGTYSYVKWQDVADRMNNVFGSRWSSEVVYQDIIGENVIVRVSVCIKDPDNGESFCQEGFGGAVNDGSQEAGNPFKSAYSKALKDACKKWGVGLYLDEENESTSSPNIPQGFVGKELATPKSTNMSRTDSVETNVPNVPSIPNNSMMEEKPVAPVDVPPMADKFDNPVSTAGQSINSMQAPPGINMSVSSETTIKQVAEDNVVPIKPPALPKSNTVNLSAGEKPMLSKVPPIKTGEVELISDVQKAALHSILKILNTHGVDYETLATEAFELNGVVKDVIPEPDKLTYQEAVHVVKYGNDKFRKR